MKIKILIIVGTRPNFVKISQFQKLVAASTELEIKVLHTGQHNNEQMSDIFLRQFNIQPDFFLKITQTTPNSQIAEMMLNMEPVIKDYNPDCIMVVGDVNSTLAASITANKLGIKVAHLEAGLRSFDRSMPEEINRILTDAITDIFFVTEESGIKNLLKEGVKQENIHLVGNTMIDTLVAFKEEIDKTDILEKLNVVDKNYFLLTIHRPSNVDTPEGLNNLISLISSLKEISPVVFPIHPRTVNNLKKLGLYDKVGSHPNIKLLEPLDYFSFQKLVKHAKAIITDSGGVQEESTFTGVPCLTLRPNTERPVTIEQGTNTLLSFNEKDVIKYIKQISEDTYKKGTTPEKWDGKSSGRILTILANYFQKSK